MNFIKSTLLAAGMIATATFAQAATVAEISTQGDYIILDNGQSTGIGLDGTFSAFLDTGFDTSATNDFLFELDLEATGIPTIDEELLVPGITGDDIIGFALSILFEIDLAFPGAIGAVIDEVLDGNLDQREIGTTGIWLGFDFAITGFGADSASGNYEAFLSDGEFEFGGISAILAEGVYDGSATISTVSTVPLPATLPLLAFGGAGLMALGRRRKS